MGCRLVACITVFVIICLELLTNIIAFPSNKINNDVEIPIHKRSLETGEQHTFKSEDFDDIKTIHAFSAEPGEILSIKFESIQIDNPRYDVINVYSGTPQQSTVSEKSKTTEVQSVLTQAEFKDQIKRMPLLISSKSASDTIQNVLIQTDKLYQADSNELTVLFDKSYNGQFVAMIESRPAPKSKNFQARSSLTRNARDPNEVNLDEKQTVVGNSFQLCPHIDDIEGKQHNDKINNNYGVITSHPGFNEMSSDSDPNLGIEKYADYTCSADIQAEGDITVEIGDIQLSDYDITCSGSHLMIEDLNNSEQQKVKFCDSDDAFQKYQFSNNIRLTLSLGPFLADAAGFKISYNGTLVEKEEVQQEKEEVPEAEETTGKKPNKQIRQKLIQSENPNNGITPTKAAKNENTSQKPKGTQLLPGFFIISCIVVAILLIVILSAAGAIACYRNHQQEQIITSMHERLSDIQGTGYSPVDGSHTSLRNKMKMMPADGGSIVCQKVTEEDHRLLSSPESNK